MTTIAKKERKERALSPRKKVLSPKNLKKERIECRISNEDKDAILAAAEMARLSVSEFIMKSALEAAQKAALKERDFIISEEDWPKLFEVGNLAERETKVAKTRAWLQSKGVNYEEQGINKM